MFKRIIKAIIRRLKRQSATDVHKEWLLQHGLRIGPAAPADAGGMGMHINEHSDLHKMGYFSMRSASGPGTSS